MIMKIKDNISLVILAALVSGLFILAMISANSDILSSYRCLETIQSFNSYLSNGLDINNNHFEATRSKPYIQIPTMVEVNRIDINISDNDNLKKIKVWFSDKTGFDANNYKIIKVPSDGRISIKNLDYNGTIKIQFVTNGDTEFTIESIDFYKLAVFSNKHLIAKCLIAFIIISILIYIGFLIGKKSILAETKNLIWMSLLLGGLLIVLLCFVTNSYFYSSYFVGDFKDTFMDYFNSLALLNNPDPYYLDASYPAICYVILGFMHSLLPKDLQVLNDGFELRENAIAMLGFIVLFSMAVYVIYKCILVLIKKETDKKYAILLILSGPFLYTLERGNILLISFALLMVYCTLYTSEDKHKRYIAYVALGLSASIKIYPAIFGLLTLKRKNMKETISLVAIGIASFILPFFAFDGIATLKEFLTGLTKANEIMTNAGTGYNFSFNNCVVIFNALFGTSVKVSTLFLLVLLACLLLLAYFGKKEWQCLFLIATGCIWFPYFSYTYILILYIPALISYSNQELNAKSKVEEVLFSILFLPLMLPQLPFVDYYADLNNVYLHMSYSTLIINIVIIAMIILIVSQFIKQFIPKDKLFGRRLQFILGLPCLIFVLGLGSYMIYNRSYNPSYDFKGKGTSWNPYQISSKEDFLYLQSLANSGDHFNGAYFIQTSDIAFDGVTSVNPIGWGDDYNWFSGYYDGQGHTISDFYSLSDNDENMGLFGVVDGEIRNLCLTNCNIGGSVVGGIASELASTGKISNCSVNGILYGYKVGGIAGTSSGIIENCVAFVNVDAKEVNAIADTPNVKIINSFSNIKSSTMPETVIDDKTFDRLNNYVSLNNDLFMHTYKMVDWDISSEGFLYLVR